MQAFDFWRILRAFCGLVFVCALGFDDGIKILLAGRRIETFSAS